MNTAFANATILSLLLAAMPTALRASETGTALFVDIVTDLIRQDQALQGVRLEILNATPRESACGSIQDGDLVAHYCGADRTIYTTTSTLANVQSSFGTAGLRYLAAHELAHGRQHAVTGYSRALVWSSVLDELQADCIAGAYLRRTYGYDADSASAEPIQRFAYSIGDRGFWQKDWHGNPRLRLAALNRGLRKGDPASCLSSSRFNYASLLEQGQSWLQRLQQLRQR